MIFGYGRISKGENHLNRIQIEAFERAKADKIFTDSAFGTRWHRPQFREILNQLKKDDVVVVWKLDSLSRSLKDLLTIMERIDNAGAGFVSLTENIDTTTPAGRMMMKMVRAFTEFEREILKERTRAGLESAKRKGRIGGRPPKLTNDQERDILDNIWSGRRTGAEMSRLYDVSTATISRLLSKYRARSF